MNHSIGADADETPLPAFALGKLCHDPHKGFDTGYIVHRLSNANCRCDCQNRLVQESEAKLI